MIPLYTETEFNEAKSRDPLPLKCGQCQNPFSRPKSVIQRAIAGRDHHSCEYCSRKCLGLHKYPPLVVTCSQCGKEFRKEPFQANKSPRHFCSRSCNATWQNLHKKHGTRRSKLEKWLEEQLTRLYPDLEFHFNRKDAIGSELDIFIPSLMLAFELNGIYHYEPIHGQDKLDAVQSNDRRKFAACHEAGISLCSIDTSSMNYFKPKKAERFLAIIQKIIESSTSG